VLRQDLGAGLASAHDYLVDAEVALVNKQSGDPAPLQSFEVGEQDLDKGRARGRRLVADLHEDSTLRGASAGITTSFDIHASSPLDAPRADGGWPQ